MSDKYFSADITFCCCPDCPFKNCERHRSHIALACRKGNREDGADNATD